MLEDLLGGTPSMRAAGQVWLPKEPREEHQAYINRLNRSFLYNAYKNTISRLTAKPFTQPVTVKNEPDSFGPMIADMDLSGRDLTSFGREMFNTACIYGYTTCLVDYPQVPESATLADELYGLKARPIFVH